MKIKFPRWDSNMTVGAAAILISACALYVSIVQTNLMQQQSNAAVWPHLEIATYLVNNEFSLIVKNKGVGPAVIQKIQLNYHGKPYEANSIINLAREIIGKQDTIFTYYSDALDQRVIAPQETVEFLVLRDSLDAAKFIQEAQNIKLSIAYASVYGQLWVAPQRHKVFKINNLQEFDKLAR